jgi:hypothetical protein
MLDDERTSRQRRLVEVGPLGQARIESASFQVPADDAGGVETEYLRRAGAGDVRSGGQRAPFVHAEMFGFESCRTVAHGAFAALGKLKSALELERR